MKNINFIKYKLLNKIKTLFGEKNIDDFNWGLYNIHYRGELESISKIHTLVLQKDDYIFDNDKLEKRADILPLHPNHRLLYETILQLKPSSIMEFGSGGGDHLHNLSALLEGIDLKGFELSEDQIKYMMERHPDLKAEVKKYDITLPIPYNTKKVDISYSQAVIMHIQTGNGHLVALSNMFNVAKKQVLLMENWKKHNIMNDIKQLYDLKVINWPDLYFYYRKSEELKKPHLMVISSTELKQYPRLNNYEVLSKMV